MLRLLKVLIYLTIFVGLGLLAFAYVGPLLGFDFSPDQVQVVIPLELRPD